MRANASVLSRDRAREATRDLLFACPQVAPVIPASCSASVPLDQAAPHSAEVSYNSPK